MPAVVIARCYANGNQLCFCRYSNPSQLCEQLEGDDAYEYRKFRGLTKRQFSFMAASEALQVRFWDYGLGVRVGERFGGGCEGKANHVYDLLAAIMIDLCAPIIWH